MITMQHVQGEWDCYRYVLMAVKKKHCNTRVNAGWPHVLQMDGLHSSHTLVLSIYYFSTPLLCALLNQHITRPTQCASQGVAAELHVLTLLSPTHTWHAWHGSSVCAIVSLGYI